MVETWHLLPQTQTTGLRYQGCRLPPTFCVAEAVRYFRRPKLRVCATGRLLLVADAVQENAEKILDHFFVGGLGIIPSCVEQMLRGHVGVKHACESSGN